MEIITGIILVILGCLIIKFGDRQFGKYGSISKWLFNPPWYNDGYIKFSKKLTKWVLGCVLIYLGIVLIFNKMSWIGL